MFEKFKNFLGGVLLRLISRNDIKSAFGVDLALTAEMENAITLWNDAYRIQSEWLQQPHMKSLGLPIAISKEVARLVTVEFDSQINNDDFLNTSYSNVKSKLRERIQRGIQSGGMIFKPYIANGKIVVDYVPEGYFFPVKYDSNGEMTSVVLPEFKVVGDKMFTRLEYHELNGEQYTIRNRAFVRAASANTNMLGAEIPLTAVPEWANLAPETTWPDIGAPLFAYFKMPGDNRIDPSSPLGVSVYADALNLIEDADRQYTRIDWEYTGTELAIEVDETALIKDKKGNYRYPQHDERLYRTYDFGAQGADTYKVFSPAIRDDPLFRGLDEILRRIELNCGLAYGTISNPNSIARTATEIVTSRQRSYALVKDIQNNLQTTLTDLVEAMNKWAYIGGLNPYNNDIDISFNWDDSIIVDKMTQLESMRQDAASGMIRTEIYLAEKYGVSEEEARKMMPENNANLTEPTEPTPGEE